LNYECNLDSNKLILLLAATVADDLTKNAHLGWGIFGEVANQFVRRK